MDQVFHLLGNVYYAVTLIRLASEYIQKRKNSD